MIGKSKMVSMKIWLIYAALLTTSILAQDSGQRKLVCSQFDGSIDAPKGYCSRVDGICSCSTDCTKSLSIPMCICTRTDLNYARDQQLAECNIWTQQAWTNYVTSSRQNSTNIDLPPPASNTPDGKGLLFSTSDGSLAWPMTDGRDMGNLLIHGPHCLEMIRMFNKQISNGHPLNNVYDRLHSEHCRRLARRVLYYYENEEKHYQVRPASLCNDLRTSYYTESRLSENLLIWTQLYGRQLFKQLLNIDNMLPAGNKNKYKENFVKSISSSNKQFDFAAVSNSIYDQLYANAEKEESKKPSQQRMFDTISGQNLGDLLVKDWLELSLTNAERDFLNAWESEVAVRTVALGIYCIQGKGEHAPIAQIRNLLLIKTK